MLKLIRNTAAALGITLSMVAVAVMSTPVFAQPGPIAPRSYSPRAFPTQQTHYLRFSVSFNSCVLVSNTCSVKVGALPYNAYVVRAFQQIITSFNSGTTDTMALGVASGGAQLVAAQSVHGAAGGGTTLTVVAANVGITVTGNGATPTGTLGGFDVWATYAQTGAAPTAGQAIYIIEYFGANDGSCTNVPLGSTATAC